MRAGTMLFTEFLRILSVTNLVFLQNACQIDVNVRLFAGHCVHVSFVFIHIVALIVIFKHLFAKPPPGRASARDGPRARGVLTGCRFSVAGSRTVMARERFISSNFFSFPWWFQVPRPAQPLSGGRPARGCSDLPIATTISLARAQLSCQANSGAISYRQEKILQFPPPFSCRQEFRFWNCPRVTRSPQISQI